MFDVLLTASVSFVIAFLAIPIVLKVATEKRLFDIPDERKVHSHKVASLGGIGIFCGFIISCLLSIQGYLNPEFQYFFAAAFIIFFLGLKDDLIVLSATKKFIGQLMAASIIIHLGGLRLDSLYGVFGFDRVPELFSYLMTYLTVIVVINSFNLIDGIDGLAASVGTLTMLVLGTYFFVSGMQAYALMAFAMTGSLIAFLIFNHHPARIFMGDSGSLMIGLVNAILIIKFINVATDPLATVPVEAAVAVGISILIFPLMDTLRVFSIRIANGKSPFTPDRNHIHHLLLRKGMGHSAITFSCVAVNLAFIILAYNFRHIGPTYLTLSVLLVAFVCLGLLFYRSSRSRMYVSKKANNPDIELQLSSKVVTLTKEATTVERNN